MPELMIERLGRLAEIRTGTYISKKDTGDDREIDRKRKSAVEPDPNGNILMVQQGDIQLAGMNGDLVRIEYLNENLIERERLLKGDVLLRSKGRPMVSAVFQPDAEDTTPTLAASSIMVIRAREEILQPLYLSWLINSDWGQGMLADRRSGQSIPFVSKKILQDIAIPCPPIKAQAHIAEIGFLAKQQEELATRYRIQIDRLLTATVFKQKQS